MAEYECALQGRYYFMKQDENAYISTDVTENTNEIYDALYPAFEFTVSMRTKDE